MAKDGSGWRLVGWAALIVVVVGIAGGAIAFKFGLIGDERTFIDINSGDIARDRSVLGFSFGRKVTPTDFGDLARKWGLAKPDRDWQPVTQRGSMWGSKTDFPMSRAQAACRGAMTRLANEKTEADKKNLLAQYVKLLQAGNEDGMETLSRVVGVEQEKHLTDSWKKNHAKPTPATQPSGGPATQP